MGDSFQKKPTILYIDDEADNLEVFKATFRLEFNVITATTIKQGYYYLKETPIDLVISDFKMPEKNGIDFLEDSFKEFPDVVRLLLTAYGDADTVTSSVNRAHIFAVATKPWEKDNLSAMIRSGLSFSEMRKEKIRLFEELKKSNEDLNSAYIEIKKLKSILEIENRYLKKEIESEIGNIVMIGASKALKNVSEKIDQVAGVDSTVLIMGETGTGKELIARTIHKVSGRNTKPFVKLNCAALPSQLVESELFGYERGAFTDARQTKQGLFEIANGGTIFLDEIGELPLDIQPKLLRVLQDGDFYRVGGTKPIQVDVRIIAATNRNLGAEQAKGLFRADLYYRLNIFPILAPALRERVEDIPSLVEYFMTKYQRKLGLKIKTPSDKLVKSLGDYSWPGNIRELESVVERSMIISSRSGTIDGFDFGPMETEKSVEPVSTEFENISTLDEMEKAMILKALKKAKWKISGKNGAAQILKLNHNTLRSKMIKYGIEFWGSEQNLE